MEEAPTTHVDLRGSERCTDCFACSDSVLDSGGTIHLPQLVLLIGDNSVGKSRFAQLIRAYQPDSSMLYHRVDGMRHLPGEAGVEAAADRSAFVQRATGWQVQSTPRSAGETGMRSIQVRRGSETAWRPLCQLGAVEPHRIDAVERRRIDMALTLWWHAWMCGAQRLWFEHPEDGLHPQNQARIVPLLVACLGAAPNLRVVVETHSDTIVNVLGDSIYRGVIAPDQVALLCFVRPQTGPTKITKATFDAEGMLHNYPPGLLAY